MDRPASQVVQGTSGRLCTAADPQVGEEMLGLAETLFPLHRSQTGAGLRRTLEILSGEIPIKITELQSGTKVLDWEIPNEWEIHDAFIANEAGERVVDYAQSNLHVVNGSQPIKQTMSWKALQDHVHTVEHQPDRIPYRTCFFRDEWGFCVTHRQRDRLRQGGPWHVEIDARHFTGSLSLGECLLPGDSDQAVLIHCHTCHPSLANDNLSGMVVATSLAKYLASKPRRYTYRLLFAPATIGVIGWLALQSSQQIANVRHGLVLTLLGDDAPLTYKETRAGHQPIDSITRQVLACQSENSRCLPFDPFGYDERQFNSPGYNLPVGRLSRSVPGDFAAYHTSGDSLGLLKQESLQTSLETLIRIIQLVEASRYPVNLQPQGEPMLGRYGIFRAFGQRDDRGRVQAAMMWILNLADGKNCIENIVDRSGLPTDVVKDVIEMLASHGLIDCREYPI